VIRVGVRDVRRRGRWIERIEKGRGVDGVVLGLLVVCLGFGEVGTTSVFAVVGVALRH